MGALTFKLEVLAFKLVRVDMEVRVPHPSFTNLVRVSLIGATPYIYIYIYIFTIL